MASNEHSWNEERNELLREKEALAGRFLSAEQKLKATEGELRTRDETILQLQKTLEKKEEEIRGLQERLCCLQTSCLQTTEEKRKAWKEQSELLVDTGVDLKDQHKLETNRDSVENDCAMVEKKAHVFAGDGNLNLVDHEGGEDDLDAESYPGGRSEEVDRETKAKALAWCQDFLSGTWKTIPEADFQITVVSGGLSNLLYMCSLSDRVQCVGEEPRRVLLRVYGAIRHNRAAGRSLAVEAGGGEDSSLVTFDSLMENVMFAILAERSLGPKLYGTFPQGRLEQHIPNSLMRTEQFADPSISAEIATQMARFHTMVMPFNKEPRWLFETLDTYMDKVMKLKFEREAQVKKFKKLLKFDLPAELERLRELLAATPSPVVFCHNDMNSGNILCLDGQDPASTERLRLIDFEYSSYNYRGFDFGNHFCEWMYDYTYNEWPFFKATPDNYPTREQQLYFIRNYLAEQGGYPDNTTQEDQTRIQEEMLIEANRYALASHFFWGLWSIIQARISKIEFGYLNYALSRFYSYVQLKNLYT